LADSNLIKVVLPEVKENGRDKWCLLSSEYNVVDFRELPLNEIIRLFGGGS